MTAAWNVDCRVCRPSSLRITLESATLSTFVELCFVIFDIAHSGFSLSHEVSVFYRDLERVRILASPVLMSSPDDMLRISTFDTADERTLVVEGTLVNPWVAELRRSSGVAGSSLEGRSLVIDLTNATTIDREGEAAIFELMQGGAKFCCRGVLTKHVLKQLADKCHAGLSDVMHEQRSAGVSEEEG
jgi:hypothetical protein